MRGFKKLRTMALPAMVLLIAGCSTVDATIVTRTLSVGDPVAQQQWHNGRAAAMAILTIPDGGLADAIALGDTVTDGVPSAGAGNLESEGATDIYQFTVTAPQYVTFEGSGCPDSIRAILRTAMGTEFQSSSMCSFAPLRLLYPGHYEFEIYGAVGSYELTLAPT